MGSDEDFEHASQYENGTMSTIQKRHVCGQDKWYWKDIDPLLKDEKDTEIKFDSKHRLEAYDLREKANDTFQSARTVLGMVILNHVFSAVEARITTKRWNQKHKESGSIQIDLQTDISAGALRGVLVLRKNF